MNELLLRKYAYTLAKLGMNVQKGQKVMIELDPFSHDFALLLAEECYKLGASKVNFVYKDLQLNKLDVKYHVSQEEIEEIKPYEKEEYNYFLDGDVATIRLESEDPKLLEDVDDEYSHAIFSHVDNLRNIMRFYSTSNKKQWCIAIVPNSRWAQVIFPNEEKEVALEKFWDVLFKLMLIDEKSDPVENWKNKMKENKRRAEYIDSLELTSLHYTSSNGTDFIVGLTEDSKFNHDAPESEIKNMCNLPTEEICTSPDKFSANGKIYSTRPLVLGGKVIPSFGFIFKDGKVIDVEASKCRDLLIETLNTDEGSSYLGEVALVGYHSPISESGLIYYTTLIDENASCHLAIGRALNSSKFNKESGVSHFNYSKIHIDFMVGAKDTSIIGTRKNGEKVVIFKDGDFAF